MYISESEGTRGAYLLPECLLAGEGQREVDPVQSHPVDLTLPAGPVPPHRGVADGAHVLVVPEPGRWRRGAFRDQGKTKHCNIDRKV